MIVRPARPDDAEAVGDVLAPLVRAGEVFAMPRDWGRADTLAYWTAPLHKVYVAEEGNEIVGTYYLHANQLGGGDHVANCGYAVRTTAAGRGVASAMCRHSLNAARAAGFSAMQFNFVVSSNTRAVALWQRFGFEIVGRLPGAFRHPILGPVDALVMFRTL